jgi:hypothetical protein
VARKIDRPARPWRLRLRSDSMSPSIEPLRVRAATGEDVAAMVSLSAAKRRTYAAIQPVFWRPAVDADARQTAWFTQLLERKGAIVLLAEDGQGVAGFAIGMLAPAPPVYDPGGFTCAIDDFCVRDEADWPSAGAALLREVRARARALGAVQVVVVCGAHDTAKRALLDGSGVTPASEWLTGPA